MIILEILYYVSLTLVLLFLGGLLATLFRAIIIPSHLKGPNDIRY